MNILSLRTPATTFGLLLLSSLFAATHNAQETASESESHWQSRYETAVYHSPSGQSLPYRLLRPQQIEPDRQYPLVLFLHGAGERGNDNQSSLVHAAEEFAREDRRRSYPAYVVIPQCPEDQTWVDSEWSLPSGRGQIPEEPSAAMSLGLELVDALVRQEPIDASRLYVTGLSMGGQGAWFAAATPPNRFAAVLAVCGGCDPDWAGRFSGVNVWAVHGEQDPVVPVLRSREMIVALTQAGHFPDLRYVEYPGVGHNSWTQTYARDDVFEWLFSKRRPTEKTTALR